MGAVEEGGKIATGVVTGLQSQPLALALVVVNVLFLMFGGWFLWTLSGTAGEATKRRDALISQLAKDCIVITPTPPKKDD